MGIEICVRAAGRMNHRPADDIEAQEFAISWRGYDRAEVRSFLREVARAVQRTDADPGPIDDSDRRMLDPSMVK
ncbi:MAG: DivIVA domain-containing protein, partial [Acidimicrobiia bacterium]|nr:DivIVA domain-containing protein [Acidimicrobiia bacterium]